ncbi:hypothetical protein P3T76_015786 [Phytophthora citrophthora]|uniref:Elicitin-like protein n=1 Tax=Phytophthora citrophthora TaxID=4793 RepID=A0AAD9FYP2_9STRA|nr:hypothetical protein P3T76_015786 [Phytophthora citrophthora]
MNFSTLNLLSLAVLFSWTRAETPPRAVFEASPIAIAAPNSPTFTLVNNSACDSEAVATIYELYERNTMVFQTCVSDASYQIFPFDGTFPTSEQIEKMSRSLACRAIFSSALLAGIPECDMGGYPLRAAAETQLKITVDIKNFPMAPGVVPTTDRFVSLMFWRRNVNNAEAEGLPCDAQSKLYSEFASNLYTVTTDGLVRLTTGMKVEYRPDVETPFSQETIMSMPEMPAFGSGSFYGSVGSSSASSTDIVVPPQNQGVPGIPPAEAGANSAEVVHSIQVRLAAIVVVVSFVLL